MAYCVDAGGEGAQEPRFSWDAVREFNTHIASSGFLPFSFFVFRPSFAVAPETKTRRFDNASRGCEGRDQV